MNNLHEKIEKYRNAHCMTTSENTFANEILRIIDEHERELVARIEEIPVHRDWDAAAQSMDTEEFLLKSDVLALIKPGPTALTCVHAFAKYDKLRDAWVQMTHCQLCGEPNPTPCSVSSEQPGPTSQADDVSTSPTARGEHEAVPILTEEQAIAMNVKAMLAAKCPTCGLPKDLPCHNPRDERPAREALNDAGKGFYSNDRAQLDLRITRAIVEALDAQNATLREWVQLLHQQSERIAMLTERMGK